MTAKDLAKLIETDEDRATGIQLFRVIENWTGKREVMPGADRAVSIARALGVSVEYLVTGKDESMSDKNAILLSTALKYENILADLESASTEVIESVKVLVRAAARGAGSGSIDRDPGYDFPAGSVVQIPSVPAQNLENRNKGEKSAEDIV